MLEINQIECQRTLTHPLHTVSTGPTPLPIDQWPPLQDPEDKPSKMMRVPREEMKKNLPHDLIVFRDANGRQRILVPKCQRIALPNPNRAWNNASRKGRLEYEQGLVGYGFEKSSCGYVSLSLSVTPTLNLNTNLHTHLYLHLHPTCLS